jgi:hypothetical protein
MLPILLYITYALLFLYFVKKCHFFNIKGIGFNYLSVAFIVKLLFSFLLFFVYYYYYGNNRFESDAFRYYDDALTLAHFAFEYPREITKLFFGFYEKEELLFITDNLFFWYKSHNYGLFNDNQTMIRINFIFSFISLGNYHIHALMMNMISFIGLTALYKSIILMIQDANQKLTFAAIFFIPTVLFWGSSVLKESLLLCCIGLFLYASLKLFLEKFKPTLLLLAIVNLIILFMLKVYVILAFIPCLSVYLLVRKFDIKKIGLTYLTGILFFYFLGDLSLKLITNNTLVEIIANKQWDFIKLAQNSGAGSYFQIPLLEENLWSLIINTPNAVLNSFFRPFPWEISSPMMLLNTIENMTFFGLIMFCLFVRKNGLEKQQLHFLFFSLTYVLLLFAIIGLTTPVSGALVRYKLPALPFLLIAFFSIIDDDKLNKKFPNIHSFIQPK